MNFCFVVFSASCLTKLIFFYRTIHLANFRDMRVLSIPMRHRPCFILHLLNIVVQLLGRKVSKKTFMYSLEINIPIEPWESLPVVVMLKVVSFSSLSTLSLHPAFRIVCIVFFPVGFACHILFFV